MPYAKCETRTARKQHKCALCLQPIEKGEKCLCLDQFNDGMAWTDYLHIHCSNFHEKARDKSHCIYCESGCEDCFEMEIRERICKECEYNLTPLCFSYARPAQCDRAQKILKKNYGGDAK